MNRYPGVKPFSEKERHLFYGRTTDIQKLYKLISLEKLVLLYGKSGLGKSSLLNAGVLPMFDEEENTRSIKIRLGAKTENSPSPIETALYKLPVGELSIVNSKFSIETDSLWLRLKNLQTTDNNKTYILVFDQFEELFTYNDNEITEFKRQLADLLYAKVPAYIRKSLSNKLKATPDFLTDDELEFIYRQPEVKVVFSIRSDRMSLLNNLTDHLPDILKNYYELKALDRRSAVDAIVKPAKDTEHKYLSPPFEYAPEAIDDIINYLTQNEQKSIETFQLQTICQYAEQLIMDNGKLKMENGEVIDNGKLKIENGEVIDNGKLKMENEAGASNSQFSILNSQLLGELSLVFRNHYHKLINGLPAEKQLPAQILLENKLIIDGNRVSLPDAVVLREKDIDKQTIAYLHDTHHLLRSEPNTTGGISYEISHDTLVAPILEAKKVREQLEKEAEKLRIDNEKLKIAEEKARKARRRLMLVVGALIIALTLSGLAVWKWIDANEQKKIATTRTIEAEQSRHLSDSLYILSEKNNLLLEKQQQELELALKDARTAKDEAVQKRIQAQLAENLAEQQKTKAQNLANGVLKLLKRSLPAGVTNVFAYYKQQADTAFVKGDYDNAIGFYQGAKLLADNTNQQTAIQQQINNAEKCIELIEQAGNHAFALDLNKAIAAYKQLQKLNPTDPKAAWRIEAFARPETMPMLKKLKLVTVKGGSFMMGSEDGGSDEKPVHKVILTDYQIGTYEVTNQQYAEFMNAYGSTEIKEGEYKGEIMIEEYEWGVQKTSKVSETLEVWAAAEGYENHPVMMVSWYGAYEFCRYYGLNLPTEAQWEFAALGGVETRHGVSYKYAGSDNIDTVAWYDSNSDSKTHAIGGKKANELNLYDMSGNVWEWCNDWYYENYYGDSPEKNPKGPFEGPYRVVRGGSWYYDASRCRSAYRNSYLPGIRHNYIGFRLVLVP